MKTCLYLLICLFANFTAVAAVTRTPSGIFVEGVIEGSGREPVFRGDTIDYVTFEVVTPGPVRLIGTDIHHSVFLAMGMIEEGEPFDVPGFPYLLFDNYPLQTPPELTLVLSPGSYLIQTAEAEFEDGDLYAFGFLPVHRAGGGFVAAPYSFTLEGQFQALDFMEGNLDGTFTVTHIPEPSATALLGGVIAVASLTRRRRS